MISRRISWALSALLVVSPFVSGCSSHARHRPRLIEIIVPSEDNPFFRAEAEAAAARARQLGYRARVDAHNDDPYQQDNLVDMAIASNAAALILDNAGADASIAAVRRAEKAGIACFLIDRAINGAGVAQGQILADNAQGARLVATEFVRLMHGSGPYAELLGKESDTNAQVRTAGFHAVLDRSAQMRLVEAQSANWDQTQAFQKTETILEAHPEIRGIIAGNDTMALGAAAAARTAGRPSLIIVGFDGSPDALAAIRAGEMQATVLQPAVTLATIAVNEADRYLKTGSTGEPERQIIPCFLVTRENVRDFAGFQRIAKD
ncbi:MAG: D-ribose ABC transporter substrate-binding protein [Acidobacteriaceae bacterium]